MKTERLLLAVLLLTLLHLGPSRADSSQEKAPRPVVTKGVKTFEIKGWGVTDELAQQDALKRAQGFLERYPQTLNLSQPWTLTADEVQHQFVKSTQPHPDQVVDDVPVKCWSVTLEIAPAQLAALEQQMRSHDRMALWAKLVVLLVLGVAAVGGYLRLEEWAHWRSTWLPRLAGVGVLAAVAAGAWAFL